MKRKFVKEKFASVFTKTNLGMLEWFHWAFVDYEHKDQQHRVEETGEKTWEK